MQDSRMFPYLQPPDYTSLTDPDARDLTSAYSGLVNMSNSSFPYFLRPSAVVVRFVVTPGPELWPLLLQFGNTCCEIG